MMKHLQNKIEYSISLMQKAEALALYMHPDGFHLAFSGGKDSQVLYHLAKEAGIKFKAHMQVTTLDPPELMAFVRSNYPNVEMHRPEKNFFQLIKEKKMLPTRQIRYCCSYLKEQAGAGTITLLGIRAAESYQRSLRSEIEIDGRRGEAFEVGSSGTSLIEVNDDTNTLDQFNNVNEKTHVCIGGKDKILLSPILKWSDNDVWTYLRGRDIEYCQLYNEGFHRIGCMFCPMANMHTKAKERLRYPKVERNIKQSIQFLIDEYDYFNNHNATANEVFNWWCSNKSASAFFGMERHQMELKFE